LGNEPEFAQTLLDDSPRGIQSHLTVDSFAEQRFIVLSADGEEVSEWSRVA
jgi:hypothetical protein